MAGGDGRLGFQGQALSFTAFQFLCFCESGLRDSLIPLGLSEAPQFHRFYGICVSVKTVNGTG
jgi:hypothetical protein